MRDRFGLDELYVADLDAIAGATRATRTVVAALAREARVMVDAGTADGEAVAAAPRAGGRARVVIGTESLPGAEAFRRLRAELPDAPLVLSLDLRGGRADLARPGAVRPRARPTRSRASRRPARARRSCSTSRASAPARDPT